MPQLLREAGMTALVGGMAFNTYVLRVHASGAIDIGNFGRTDALSTFGGSKKKGGGDLNNDP